MFQVRTFGEEVYTQYVVPDAAVEAAVARAVDRLAAVGGC